MDITYAKESTTLELSLSEILESLLSELSDYHAKLLKFALDRDTEIFDEKNKESMSFEDRDMLSSTNNEEDYRNNYFTSDSGNTYDLSFCITNFQAKNCNNTPSKKKECTPDLLLTNEHSLRSINTSNKFSIGDVFHGMINDAVLRSNNDRADRSTVHTRYLNNESKMYTSESDDEDLAKAIELSEYSNIKVDTSSSFKDASTFQTMYLDKEMDSDSNIELTDEDLLDGVVKVGEHANNTGLLSASKEISVSESEIPSAANVQCYSDSDSLNCNFSDSDVSNTSKNSSDNDFSSDYPEIVSSNVKYSRRFEPVKEKTRNQQGCLKAQDTYSDFQNFKIVKCFLSGDSDLRVSDNVYESCNSDMKILSRHEESCPNFVLKKNAFNVARAKSSSAHQKPVIINESCGRKRKVSVRSDESSDNYPNTIIDVFKILVKCYPIEKFENPPYASLDSLGTLVVPGGNLNDSSPKNTWNSVQMNKVEGQFNTFENRVLNIDSNAVMSFELENMFIQTCSKTCDALVNEYLITAGKANLLLIKKIKHVSIQNFELQMSSIRVLEDELGLLSAKLTKTINDWDKYFLDIKGNPISAEAKTSSRGLYHMGILRICINLTAILLKFTLNKQLVLENYETDLAYYHKKIKTTRSTITHF